MGKITSYARNQIHGISNPFSGATVAPSNDHTDGSWSITDIYDRESIINTADGGHQYRAGSEIYGLRGVLYKNIPPITEPYPQYPKVIESIVPIYGWDMTVGVGSQNFYTIQLPNVYFSSITSVDAYIYNDAKTTAYQFTQTSANQPAAVQQIEVGGFINYLPNANPLDTDIYLVINGNTVDGNTTVKSIFNTANFNATNTHRGWVTIKHFI
jgi:hypothetical protein